MNIVMNALANIISFGQNKRLREMDMNYTFYPNVAAGDPALKIPLFGDPNYILPDTLMIDGEDGKYTVNHDYVYHVTGESMSKFGIKNGSYLIARDFSNEENVRDGFFIINVDYEFYAKEKPSSNILYNYKLRRGFCKIPGIVSESELIPFISSNNHDSIVTTINKREDRIKEKYKQSRDFYGKEKDLILSITYHDNEMSFSFHPMDLIVGVADVCVEMGNDGKLSSRRLKK